jgi:hypothetical protein
VLRRWATNVQCETPLSLQTFSKYLVGVKLLEGTEIMIQTLSIVVQKQHLWSRKDAARETKRM